MPAVRPDIAHGQEIEVIDVPIGNGLNTKTAKKELDFGELAQLQNSTFAADASVQKRNGYTALGNLDFNSNAVTAGQALALYGKELLEVANGQLYSYSAQFDKMAPKGPLQPLTVVAEPIVQNTSNQNLADCATNLGVTVYFYQDQRNGTTGGVRVTIVDETTGTKIISDQQISATGFQPRVVAMGTKIYLAWSETVNIKGIVYDPTVPATIPGSVTIFTDGVNTGSGGTAFDMIAGSSSLYFAYVNTTTNDMAIAQRDNATFAAVTSNHFALGDAGSFWAIALGFFTSGTHIALAYGLCGTVSNGKIHWVSYNAALSAQTFAPQVLTVPGTSPLIQNLAVHEPDATHMKVMWEDRENAIGLDTTFTQTVNVVGSFVSNYAGAVTTAAAVVVRSVGLASRCLTFNAVNYYVVTYNITTGQSTQPTYYIMTEAGVIVGRFQTLTAGGFVFDSVSKLTRLPGFGSLGSSQFAYPAIVTGQTQAINGKIATTTGLVKSTISLAPLPAVTSAQLGLNTHFSGSMLADYDGFGTMEHGTHVYPESLIGGSAQGLYIEAQVSQTPVSGGGAYLTTTIDVPSESAWPLSSFFVLQAQTTAPATFTFIVIVLRQNGLAPGITNIYSNNPAVPVVLTPGSSASAVAAQLAAYINSLGNTGLSATVGVAGAVQGTWQLIVKCQQTTILVASPSFNQTLTITIIQGVPNSAALQVVWDAAFPDAAFIGNSQYFVACKNNAGAQNYNYFWFHIVGQPVVDPAPATFAGQTITAGFQININATDTADVVRQKAGAVLTANGYAIASGVGNTATQITGGAALSFTFLPQNVNVGGAIDDGLYGYIGIYREVDFAGQVHQSSPSIPALLGVFSPQAQTINSAGTLQTFVPGATGAVRIFFPTLRITSKVSPRAKVTLELYRTRHDLPGVYYRVTSQASPVFNDPTVDYIAISDSASDGTIQGNELAYTVGGVQPNIAPPAHSVVVNHKNRLFLMGCEDKKAIYFSKAAVPGQGVGFGGPDLAQCRIRFDQGSASGVVTGITMDDNLLVFFKDQVWRVSGDGPDPSGQNGIFSAPQLVTQESGCNTAKGICQTAIGVMYTSDKGVYLIDRSFQVQYLGAPVDAFKGQIFTTMTMLSDRQEIRIGTANVNNPNILYDYYEKQWGTLTNHDTVDSLIWQGVYVYVQSTGLIYKESVGAYLDPGAVGIPVLLETGWLAVSHLAGFQSVRKALIVGTWTVGTQIQVQAAYNYDETYETLQVQVIAPNDYVGAPTLPHFTAVGGTQAFGIRVDFSRQSVSAVKLLIQEISPANTTMQINGIGLEVVRQGGVRRLAQNVALSQ